MLVNTSEDRSNFTMCLLNLSTSQSIVLITKQVVNDFYSGGRVGVKADCTNNSCITYTHIGSNWGQATLLYIFIIKPT